MRRNIPTGRASGSGSLALGCPAATGHLTTTPGRLPMASRRRSLPSIRPVLDASIADQINGGLGNSPTSRCFPAGMPHMMMAFGPHEYVLTPETTYILINWDDHNRRIFTDGRAWTERLAPTSSSSSIGKWIDEGWRRPLRRAR